MLIKTDKQVDPVETLQCQMCGGEALWLGPDLVKRDPNVWQDKYRCTVCKSNFYNTTYSMWVDEETDEFYVYRETADAS